MGQVQLKPTPRIRVRRYREDDAFFHEGATAASWEMVKREDNPHGDPKTPNNHRAQAWDRGFRAVEQLMDEQDMDGADAMEAIRFNLV